ncbi:PEP-CTERM sorting domain-containing protein [Sphingomonas antarctica]|uniref:PEPxxWA-CTERM sorting domain-containing protein n=1 Tax=Sphingomonas antarctica TaxID=2040274 RepID=UPI0039E8A28B
MSYSVSPKTIVSGRAARSAAFVAATMAIVSGLSTPAFAGYSVGTFANTGRGYARGCAAEYNIGGTGAHFIVNDGSGGPCDPDAFLSQQGAVVTVNGTTDTTGTLTAAFDMSSVVRLPDAAYATSSADLAKGEVHLFASATGFSGAIAQASLSDTLHFSVAGADANTVTYIPVSFSFDGTMPGTSDPATASAELNYGFYFGNAYTYEFGDYAAGYYGYNSRYPTFIYSGDPRVSGWVSSSFASYSPLDTRFAGVYALTGASGDIPIDFSLGLSASNVALDYSHTGKISIGHVDGLSFTSDSGVFLNAVGGAVPEPASWAMIIGGFGMIGAGVRGRRSIFSSTQMRVS